MNQTRNAPTQLHAYPTTDAGQKFIVSNFTGESGAVDPIHPQKTEESPENKDLRESTDPTSQEGNPVSNDDDQLWRVL